MPIIKGFINNQEAVVLRDTGCNGVIVNQKFVNCKEYNGQEGKMILADNTIRKAPMAEVFIDTPYYTGKVRALCLPNPMYDIILGNIQGVLSPDQPNENWSAAAAAKRTNQSDIGNIYEAYEIRKEDLVKLQKEDVTIQECLKKEKTNKSEFKLEDTLVFHLRRKKNGEEIKTIVVPKVLQTKILSLGHEVPMAGHFGVKKTQERITEHFSWPGITKDVRIFCQTCDMCQKTSSKGRNYNVPLGKMPIIETPFSRIAIDIIGPLPKSQNGHRYVLTVIDYATRYPEATALQDIQADTIANALVSIYCRMGIPMEILTDQGRQFISECMKRVNELLKVKHLITTPYHPQCNGLIENFNKSLKNMIFRLSDEKKKKWDLYLDPLLFAYREVPHATTGFSPFELLYGRAVRGPLSILKEIWAGNPQNEEKDCIQYYVELRERLNTILEISRENIKEAQIYQENYYNSKTKKKDIKPGDEVLILLPTTKNKMNMKWKGPYTVEDNHYPNNYFVKINNKRRLYHANLLKKYHRRDQEQDNVKTCIAIVNVEEVEDDIPLVELSETENLNDVNISETLRQNQQEGLLSTIKKYESIFSTIPCASNLEEHEISLTCNEPIQCRPYPLPYETREKLKKTIREMEAMGVIRKSNSPYASPVVIVKKKDSSDRLCVDFRKLNKITLADPEPMTSPDDLFQKMSKAKYFTTLDLSKGFWQIAMKKEDIGKTAFVTPDGHYELIRMPFGLKNASATLVKGLRKLFEDVDNVDFYVDDIIIYNESYEEHLKTIDIALKKK